MAVVRHDCLKIRILSVAAADLQSVYLADGVNDVDRVQETMHVHAETQVAFVTGRHGS